MRTTIRIDDDLARRLKELAHKDDVTFGRMLNRMLRAGLDANRWPRPARRRFKQRTFRLGEPAFDVDKALSFAAFLEDEETLRKLAQRK